MLQTTDNKIFGLFKELIYEKLGIHFSGEKNYVLAAKLNRILMHKHYGTLDEFYQALKFGNKDSLDILVRYMTTTHTYFFREKEHFDILKNLIKVRNKKSNIIWCAASSTGEEVYSIVISLLEAGIRNFKLIASDINLDVLRHMHKGIYHTERLLKIDDSLKKKYFRIKENGYYEILPELKNYIAIKRINLVGDVDFESKIDYIFCRNVMIYFDFETRKKAVHNIIKNLKNDGYLFIGHSENIFNITDKIKSVSVSVFNKK